MNIPPPVFVGYFPKITAQRKDLKTDKGEIWLKNEIVEEICSVSDCISKAPEGWIDKWKHNDLWFYDTEAAALEIISKDKEKYDLFAYKLYPLKFNHGTANTIEIKSNAAENLKSYNLVGYDAVQKTEGVADFGCSPLSCNNACEKYIVNKYCLFDNLDYAYQSCLKIEQENWEPGPYYLFEVYRKNKK
jgi:hypothetical protein